MKLGKAIQECDTNGYIYRKTIPNKKYYKNHEKTILERILKNYGKEGLFYDDYEYFNTNTTPTTEQQKGM